MFISPCGCLSLNCISSQLVKVAKMPRKRITTTPGTTPTTARLDGRLSMPLDTISAIISTATSCQVKVR